MECTGKSKDEAKSMFLAAVNSDREGPRDATPFFAKFDAECKAIQNALMQLAEYRWVLPHAQKAAQEKLEERKAARRRDRKTVNGLTANVAGSFVNLILCTWECRFLAVACETLAALQHEVCVNAFDGVMIAGDHYPAGEGSKARDDVLCPALEAALKKSFDIDMGWSMKRHASPLVYAGGEGLKLPYAKHAEPFLEKVYRVGSQYLIQLEDGSVEVETGRDLAERFKAETAKCMLTGADGKPIQTWYANTFAETLCRDPRMKTYEKMDNNPDASECPPSVFNLWTPMPCEAWDVSRADPHSEHVAAFRKHILVLSDNDAAVAHAYT